MYQTIVMECQTREGGNSCEDCIACKECHLKNKLHRNEKPPKPKQAPTIEISP
jgi:hypothetical protein